MYDDVGAALQADGGPDQFTTHLVLVGPDEHIGSLNTSDLDYWDQPHDEKCAAPLPVSVVGPHDLQGFADMVNGLMACSPHEHAGLAHGLAAAGNIQGDDGGAGGDVFFRFVLCSTGPLQRRQCDRR